MRVYFEQTRHDVRTWTYDDEECKEVVDVKKSVWKKHTSGYVKRKDSDGLHYINMCVSVYLGMLEQ